MRSDWRTRVGGAPVRVELAPVRLGFWRNSVGTATWACCTGRLAQGLVNLTAASQGWHRDKQYESAESESEVLVGEVEVEDWEEIADQTEPEEVEAKDSSEEL